MKWITRRNIHVDRTSCPWLIRKFIDPQAEFFFVDATTDPATSTASLDTLFEFGLQRMLDGYAALIQNAA